MHDNSPPQGTPASKQADDRTPLAMERRMRIVSMVNLHRQVTVPELITAIGASPASIRRDLTWLEAQGLIARTHGGALAKSEVEATLRGAHPSYVERLSEHVTEKRAIGRCAATLVQDGETIIIDAGSTSLALIPHLAQKRDLTVISTSLDIEHALAQLAEANPTLTVISTGGRLFVRSRSFVGMVADQALAQFFVDKTFLCVGGISLIHGLTGPVLDETAIKRRMIASAQQVIVLAEHTKFGNTYANLIAPLASVHVIVTDDGLPDEAAQRYASAGPIVMRSPC